MLSPKNHVHNTNSWREKNCGKSFTQSGSLKQHIKDNSWWSKEHQMWIFLHITNMLAKSYQDHSWWKEITNVILVANLSPKNHTWIYISRQFMKVGRARNLTSVKNVFPQTLKSHIKAIHDGRMNYSCDICSKTFPSPAQLNWHRNNTHGQRHKF